MQYVNVALKVLEYMILQIIENKMPLSRICSYLDQKRGRGDTIALRHRFEIARSVVQYTLYTSCPGACMIHALGNTTVQSYISIICTSFRTWPISETVVDVKRQNRVQYSSPKNIEEVIETVFLILYIWYCMYPIKDIEFLRFGLLHVFGWLHATVVERLKKMGS